jgi:hypothetical protein
VRAVTGENLISQFFSINRARFRSVTWRWPALHRVGLDRDQVIAHGGDLIDQVFAGRIVPAVNGVGLVSHGAILPDSIRGRADRVDG